MAGRQIFKLERKIAIIAEVIGEREGKTFSRKSFAEWADLNYDSLKSCWSRNVISLDIETKLAAVANFDRNGLAWYDPDRGGPSGNRAGGRKDDVDDFRRYLRAQNGLAGIDMRRLADHRPDLMDEHLANFALDDGGQSSHPDGPAYLFLDLTLSPSYIAEGLAYGFQEVRVALSLGANSVGRFVERLGQGRASRLGNGTVIGGGTRHRPTFDICAATMDTILNGEYVTKDQPLCQVENIFLDDIISAELAVNIYSGKIIGAEGTNLPSDNKKAVVSMLIAKRLNRNDGVPGWAVLAQQRLTVVKAEDHDE